MLTAHYQCGPLKAFVLGALFGALIGIAVGLALDGRILATHAHLAALCAVIMGLGSSTLALKESHPVWFNYCQIISTAVLLTLLVVATVFGVSQQIATHGLVVTLIFLGALSGVVYGSVCGIGGLIVGVATLGSLSHAEEGQQLESRRGGPADSPLP